MANRSSNTAAVPEAKGALDRFKFEVANELGVPLTDGYNGNLTSKQNGSVGGYMVNIMLSELPYNKAGLFSIATIFFYLRMYYTAYFFCHFFRNIKNDSDMIKEETIDMFWTENEDSLLKEFFPVEGANVSVRLPGRSPGACSNRAKRLDITMRRSWTAIEDDVIRKYYPIEGGRVYLRLPGRNKDACHKRALNLGIKSQNRSERWSKAEDDILREVYPEKGALEAAKKLNSRSEEACKQRASCLGIAYNQNNLPWTDNELQILKEFYPKEGGRVKDRLCGRSRDACITKAKKLGIKYRGLSYKSFDPKREYLQYIETLIAQDQTGENEFVLTFGFLNNKIIVPVTISEGKIHGLFLTDNGHVSSLSKCGLQTMISSAEANGVSFKDGILSVECELDDYVKKLQDFINCISIIVASAN